MEKEYREAQERLRLKELSRAQDTKEYKKVLNEFKRAENRFKQAERVYKQEKFKKAVYFTGIKLEMHEVLTFAYFATMMTMLVCIICAAIAVLIFGLGPGEILMFVVPSVVVIPLFVLGFFSSYPEILASRVKAKSLGRTPEAINYMVMSMRLSPSLNRAIEFAAENTEEPLASGLKKVFWDIYMRKYDSIEEAFLGFAYDWGEWNDDLKRSLYAIRSATLEPTDEGLNRSLDKATDIILTGTKTKIEDFVHSLSGPTMILFTVGILLPMVIGAMLPMMALGSLDVSFLANYEPGTTTTEPTGPDNTPLIVFLMDIVFPVATLGYAYHILGKRPGTTSPPKVESRLTKNEKTSIIMISLIIAIGLAIFAFGPVNEQLGDFGRIIGSLPLLWGIGFGLAYYCRATSAWQKKRRDEIIQMEKEFPDALFQLGSRIAEGDPLEIAFRKTSVTMKGTLIGDLFRRIAYTLQLSKTTLEKALFGDIGILNKLPSRTIRATMKTVVEVEKKDPTTAGQTIVGICTYLRDMKKV
ncbi:MAG: hypothetical protein JSW28_03860, partial [Thermoplasmata archaeon]